MAYIFQLLAQDVLGHLINFDSVYSTCPMCVHDFFPSIRDQWRHSTVVFLFIYLFLWLRSLLSALVVGDLFWASTKIGLCAQHPANIWGQIFLTTPVSTLIWIAATLGQNCLGLQILAPRNLTEYPAATPEKGPKTLNLKTPTNTQGWCTWSIPYRELPIGVFFLCNSLGVLHAGNTMGFGDKRLHTEKFSDIVQERNQACK